MKSINAQIDKSGPDPATNEVKSIAFLQYSDVRS